MLSIQSIRLTRQVLALCAAGVLLAGAAEPPGGAEKTAIEAPPAGTGAPAARITYDAALVLGDPPAFPLPAAQFADLRDSYADTEEAGRLQEEPLWVVLAALRASSHEHLAAAADPQLTIAALNGPQRAKHRGAVVRFEGQLGRTSICELPVNRAGFERLYLGWVECDNQPVRFAAVEPLAGALRSGDKVLLTGIYLKRFYSLEARPQGTSATWGPLVFVRRVEQAATPHETRGNTIARLMRHPLAVGAFIVIGVAVVAYFYMVSKLKTRQANYFTRLKKSRESGGNQYFPAPRSRRDRR